MINLFVLFLAFVTGVLTKTTDIIEDNSKFSKFEKYSMLLGIIYGVLIFVTILIEPLLIPLVIGTIIGLILTKKIDGKGHVFGIIILFTFFLIYYLNTILFSINFLLMIVVFVCANLLDEFFSDYSDKNKKNLLVKKIFLFRPFLEISAFLISLITTQWIIWFTILFFDIAYNIFSKIEDLVK